MTDPTRDAMAVAIERIADDIRRNPAQFSFNGTAIGTQVIAQPGHGTGMSVVTTVSGSTQGDVVGYSSQVNIGSGGGSGSGDAWVVELLKTAAELRRDQPDRGVIRSAIESLKAQALPSVVLTAVNGLVATALGIGL